MGRKHISTLKESLSPPNKERVDNHYILYRSHKQTVEEKTDKYINTYIYQ